jgi:hypothetical protein
MPVSRLYTGSYGLSNRVPPELIPYDAETGVAGLQQADNVLIGEAGQLYGRKGSRQVFSENSCHSPFSVPGGMLFVKEKDSGAVLSLAKPDNTGLLSIKELGNLTYKEEWLSWFELDGEYWFSSQYERGVVSSSFDVRNWPVSTPMMADDNEFEYAPLPFGKHSEQHGPFTISSVDSVIFFSEPGQPTICRTAESYTSVEGPIRILASVQEGVFVSDDKSVWFFSGRQPRQWSARRVLDYPAIEYCRINGLVSASDMGFDSGGLGVVFMTVRGPCFGFSDGTIINLTEKQFAMPKCEFTRGSMMVAQETTLIISVE